MANIAQRFAARDLARCIAIADARKAEDAQARRRCLANAGLVALLTEQAERRGSGAIDWPEYFRNLGI